MTGAVGDLVEFVDQLDGLPVSSVIRTGTARVAQKVWAASMDSSVDPRTPDVWLEVGSDEELRAVDFDDFPHRILYRGGAQ